MIGCMNRYNSRMKALRKQRIYPGYYSNLHQYSKNKIHCSCSLCAAKTRTDGSKRSDQLKIDRLEYAE